MKQCPTCKSVLPESDFLTLESKKKLRSCLNCSRDTHRKSANKWKLTHRKEYLAKRKVVDAKRRQRRKVDPELRQKWLDYKKKYRQRPAQKEKNRAYVIAKTRRDPEWAAKQRSRGMEYRRRNRARAAVYVRNKRRNDIGFRIADNLRRRINAALRGGIKSASTYALLGCSIDSFKMYFESKFTPGMSWEAFLNGEIHIDHIIPCSVFDMTKPEHQKACFHFSNLQPLSARDNLSKSSKVVTNQFQLL